MTARSLKPLLAASALTVLIASSGRADPPPGPVPIPVLPHPIVTGPGLAEVVPGMTCHTPKAGETPSLGCTKMIEYYQYEIKKETASCKAGRIDAEDCASTLRDYRSALGELRYHPQ